MTDQLDRPNASETLWRWWPCLIGGFCGPLLAHVLTEWMPPAVAVALAFFLMWALVGLIFTVSPPSRQWSFGRWAGGGALGALIAGSLAFVTQG